VSDPLRSILDAVAAGRNPAPDGTKTVFGRPAGGKLVGAVLGFTAHGMIAADVDETWLRRVLPGELGGELTAAFLTALAQRLDTRAGTLDVMMLAPAAGRLAAVPPGGAAGHGAAEFGRAAPGRAEPGRMAGLGGAGGAGGTGGPGTAVLGGAPAGPGGDARLAGRGGQGVRHLAVSSRATAEPGAPVLPGGLRALPDDVGHPRLARAHRYRDEVRGYTVDGGLLLIGRGLAGRWEVAVEVEPAYRGRGVGRHLVGVAPALVPPGEHLWAQVAPANVASVRAFLAAGYRPVGVEVLFPVPRWEGSE
jgi:GNAT superfamily N-acetyltransferase